MHFWATNQESLYLWSRLSIRRPSPHRHSSSGVASSKPLNPSNQPPITNAELCFIYDLFPLNHILAVSLALAHSLILSKHIHSSALGSCFITAKYMFNKKCWLKGIKYKIKANWRKEGGRWRLFHEKLLTIRMMPIASIGSKYPGPEHPTGGCQIWMQFGFGPGHLQFALKVKKIRSHNLEFSWFVLFKVRILASFYLYLKRNCTHPGCRTALTFFFGCFCV